MKIKFSYHILYLGFFLLQLLFLILSLNQINLFGFIPILLLIYYIVAPGLLLLKILNVSLSSGVNQIIHSVGLSISILMFSGLLINITLPYLGINNPLTQVSTILYVNIFILALGVISYFKEKGSNFQFNLNKIDKVNAPFIIFPILLIFQAVAGAQLLNNGGSSVVSMALVIEIIFYCLAISILKNKLNRKIIYPIALYSISASILLMLSMRSNYVVGWDINQELYVFQLTKKLAFWSISSYRDAYNSMLSITILPTMLSYLTKFNDEYIFKSVYPLIFSLAPVGLYYLINVFTKRSIAFLSVLIFIFQPSFTLEIVMLARQEIGLLFLILLLFTFFSNTFSKNNKLILFIVYYFSLVVSHYSTTYIFMFLFLMLFMITVFNSMFKTIYVNISNALNFKTKINTKINKNTLISWKVIIVMLLFTFFWNSLLTNNSDGLIYVYRNTLNNINKVFIDEFKSGSVRSFIWNRQGQYTLQDVVTYADETKARYQFSDTNFSKYDSSIYSNYIIAPSYSRFIKYGNYIDGRTLYLYPIISLTLKIAMIFGFLYLILNQKGKKSVPIEYKLLSSMSLMLIFVFMVLPSISLAYNFERLIQQSLILLALPIVIGLYLMFNAMFIRKEAILFFLSSFLILIYFLFTSGIFNQLAGGPAHLQYNNFGGFYDRYYFHNSEKTAILWISNNHDRKSMIYADQYSKLKFLPYSSIKQKITTDVIPSALDKNAYVYSSYFNTVNAAAIVINQNDQELSFIYPSEFLKDNKNKIYSTGNSGIFK